MASLATDMEGLKIALVHMIFNTVAVGLVLPLASIRRIPINLARWLAILAVRNKLWVVAYVVVTFVVVPVAGIVLL